MMLSRHLTFANVCSALALTVALSTGGAYAAAQINGSTIKAGTVKAKQLASNAVVSSKIKNGTVTGADVQNGSLTAADLAPGVLPNGTIKSGTTVTGVFNYDDTTDTNDVDDRVFVAFPAPAPAEVTGVDFAVDSNGDTTDDNAACTGTVDVPTAPPGKVCLYGISTSGIDTVAGDFFGGPLLGRAGFYLTVKSATDNADVFALGSWAYTAP